MNFIDSYLYLISIPFLLVGAFLLLWYKKRIVTSENVKLRRNISIAIGSLQIIYYLVVFPMYAIQQRIYHTFLTDLCPFSSFTFGIALLIGKEKYIKMIMPWMLLGAILTIVSSSPDMTKEGVFSGLISYLRHITTFIVFFWALINLETKYSKKDVINVFVYVAVFVVWVILVSGIPYWSTHDPRWGVFSTGLIKPSWSEMSFHYKGGTETVGDYAFFASFGMPYPWTTILFYGLSCGIAFVLILLTNLYTKRTRVA